MDYKPTIEDVARLANVSIATVSRVINNQGGVRKATEDRIVNAIDELGYIRSAVARSMKRKETNTIGIIVPDITNPFFPHVVAGIEQKAREKGYYTILSSTNESQKVEEEIVKIFLERGVDGVIITTANENGDHIKRLQDQGIPIVAVDRAIKKFEVDTVLVDNINGSYQAVRELILQGHDKIGIICGPQDTTPGLERYLGYKKALEEYNIPLDPNLVFQGDFRETSGYKGALTLFYSEHRPTAIFSSNNQMTIGCVKALNELGWKLGEEVSFIGFDDVEIATFIKPKLSVVSRPMTTIGEIAFQLVYDRIHNKENLPKRELLLTPELIIRESCQPNYQKI